MGIKSTTLNAEDGFELPSPSIEENCRKEHPYPSRPVNWERAYERGCSCSDCNPFAIDRDIKLQRDEEQLEQEEGDQRSNSLSAGIGTGSRHGGDDNRDQTASQYPVKGWSNLEDIDIGGGKKEHERSSHSYEPRTSFKKDDPDDDAIDTNLFERLQALHMEHFSNYPYASTMCELAESDRDRMRDRIEKNGRLVLSYSIADSILSSEQAREVVVLLSRTKLNEGSLRSYSFEQITLGLCSLLISKYRPRLDNGYSLEEAREIQQDNVDRLWDMIEHLNDLQYSEGAKINDSDFQSIKKALKEQHSHFEQ
ncbi:hypothetical protein [Halomicrococcus sp. SG-WS-1]|uniref:hypothetical protein n=1 Tax=Halomicrococcus sp. SG-WS-1 TaxID=3439057 RepID=UPI003F7ABD39